MADQINKKTILMPNGQPAVLNPDIQQVQERNNTTMAKAAAIDSVNQQQPVVNNAIPEAVNMFAMGKQQANRQRTIMDAVQGRPNVAGANINVDPASLRIPQGGLSTTPQQKAPAQKKAATPDVRKPAETRGADFISSMFTPPEDEERMRKASMANMKILALGDALRHIGNIYNTTNYAPAQQFNSPEMEQYQQYMQGKATRDAANKYYMQYQMQKAAQDAKNKQWERDYQMKMIEAARKAGMDDAQIKHWQQQIENQKAYNEGRLANEKQRLEDSRKHNEVLEKQGRDRIGIARGQLGVAQRNAASNELRAKAYNTYMNRYGTGGGGGTRTGKGYRYATKNGYIELPSDYLSKNNINRKSLLTQLERAGIIDDEWLDNYDTAEILGNQGDMLDEAISNWLMEDDAAEGWMTKHFIDKNMNGTIAPGNTWSSKNDPFGEKPKENKKNNKDNPFG